MRISAAGAGEELKLAGDGGKDAGDDEAELNDSGTRMPTSRAARGLAQVRLLLTDGCSPIYYRGGSEQLRAAASRALADLQPTFAGELHVRMVESTRDELDRQMRELRREPAQVGKLRRQLPPIGEEPPISDTRGRQLVPRERISGGVQPFLR